MGEWSVSKSVCAYVGDGQFMSGAELSGQVEGLFSAVVRMEMRNQEDSIVSFTSLSTVTVIKGTRANSFQSKHRMQNGREVMSQTGRCWIVSLGFITSQICHCTRKNRSLSVASVFALIYANAVVKCENSRLVEADKKLLHWGKI